MLVASLISNNVKCVDKKILYDIDLICKIKINNGDITEFYFDNFSYFFEKLWDKDSIGLNILYTFLFIIKILLDILRSFFSALIIKHLNPVFYLCSFELYFFAIRFISLIKHIINKDNISVQIYNIIAKIVSLIGITIYLELIELKFCDMNRNLKQNIEERVALNIILIIYLSKMTKIIFKYFKYFIFLLKQFNSRIKAFKEKLFFQF